MSSDGYSELVREHFFAPIRPGRFPAASQELVEAGAGERRHGAEVRFQLQVRDDVILDSRFQAYGCPHTIAAASWYNQRLPGMSLERAAALGARQAAEQLQVPAEKLGSILVVEDALAACLEIWRRRLHN
jgi:NifU-like protein involved in Fe-S cluster formation